MSTNQSVKYLTNFISSVIIFTIFSFLGCSSGGGGDSAATKSEVKHTLFGKIQKGNFIDGVIVATKLEDNGSLSSTLTLESSIDTEGKYTLSIPWSGLTHLSATGHYYDEYHAKNSADEVELEALYDVGRDKEININLLTSLESSRIRELLALDTNFSKAKQETKETLEHLFSLPKEIPTTDLDMFDFNSSLSLENKSLLLLSATFLKVTEESDSASTTAPLSSSMRKGVSLAKITPVSRFVSDFAKNGKVDSSFKSEWSKIIEDDPVTTLGRVEESLDIEVGYEAPSDHWSKRVQLSVSSPRYVFDGSVLKKIIYEVSIPLANYADRSKVYKLSYSSVDGSAKSTQDYTPVEGEFSFTFTNNTQSIEIDILAQASESKTFELLFSGVSEGLEVTNPTLEVEILQNTISAFANPTLNTLALNSIEVDSMKSSVTSSSSVVFSGSSASEVSLGLTLNAQTQVPAEYFANIYLSVEGVTPLFLQKVIMPTIGDVSGRVYYQSADIFVAFDAEVRAFLAEAYAHDKEVKFRAEVVVDESSSVSINSQTAPKFVQVSSRLGEHVELSTFEYKEELDSSCSAITTADGFDKSRLYAEVDMYGMYERDFLGSPIGIEYDDVCVEMLYDASSGEYALTLEDGFGTLDSDMLVQVHGEDVTFSEPKILKDSIEVAEITLPLPDKHTLHHRDFLGNISPRGLSSVTFTPKAFSATEDLSQSRLTGEFSKESYLHGKSLPLYFRLSKASLDSSGLSFVSSEREYVFGYSNATRSNAHRFSNPAGGEYVFTLDADGISSETPLAFNAHSLETHFPKMQSEVAAFEIQIQKSELVAKSLTLSETHTFAYQQNCPENECSSRQTEGTLALETNKTKLYSNGETLSSNETQKVSVAWGEKELQSVFAREKDVGVSIYTPGYILPTNEPEMVGEYLYGSVEEDSATLLMHPSSSQEAKSGEYNYAGVNVGSILHSQEPSLQTPSMRVTLGDGVALELKNTQDTKYYVRAAGITGVFNNTAETLNTTLYGYDLNLESFKFRQIANDIDEYTKIDGDVHVPGLGDFDVVFKSLAIDCSGNFRGGAIDQSQENIMLGTWKMESALTSMAFKSPEANVCSSRKNLWLGHLLKVAALKNRVELGTFWTPEGSPRDTVVTADTYNQLDGNTTRDIEDNGGYNIALKDASFNFVDGSGGKRAWVETNAKVGLPFWGAKDMSVRMTNANIDERELSVVTKEGELYIGEREKTQTNEALAMDIRANYEQNISREIFNVVDFTLPAYYNSYKTDKTPRFIGRPFEKDLIVFKTNANIDEITPKTTKVSLGASANLLPLKDPKLHIDLTDPESLKNIDANLSFFFGETTLFQDALMPHLNTTKMIEEVLNKKYSASLEATFYIALKQTAHLDKNDPYEKIAKVSAQVLDLAAIASERLKQEFYVKIMEIFDENQEYTAQTAQKLQKVIEVHNRSIVILNREIQRLQEVRDFQDDNSTLNKIHKNVYKYGLGTPKDECSWDNMLKQQVVTLEDINGTIRTVTFDEKKYALTTKHLVESARAINEFDIPKRIDQLQAFGFAGNLDKRLESLGKTIEDSKLSEVQKAYDKSTKWVDDVFCDKLDNSLDMIEDINATLKKIDDVKRATITRLIEINATLTSGDMAVFLGAMEDINEDSNFTALKEQITNIYESEIVPKLDEVSSIYRELPRLSADEYRLLTVHGLMQIEAIEALDDEIRARMQPHIDKIQNILLKMFSIYNEGLTERLTGISDIMQGAIDKASSRFSKIPLDAAELDGYAIFGNDEIHRLHMRASYTTASDANASDTNATQESAEESSDSSSSGSSTGGGFSSDSSDEEKSKDDKESDLTFTAELDIINEAHEGTSGCGGENAQSNFKVSITTEDISMGIGKKKLAVDFLQLGVVLGKGEARIPEVKGVFGAITSDEGMEFSKFSLYDMGLAVGIGGNERFLGAKVSSSFSSMQLGMSFLVGEVCNEKIIESILPESIGEFITMPEGRFKGYMLYGEGQTPVLEKPKVYAVGVRAKLGVWSLEGPPVIKGGLLGGGLFGYLSVVQIVGEMALLRESAGGNIRYAGDGWVAGGFGLKCDSKTWNSLEDVRENNEKCTTVDMSFALANEDEEWDVSITETRPTIPGVGGEENE
ncbi:MAG: hypothetical protein U9O86_03005 [Campylobacterota bacterium]|nr:hypothetical protein [Campylobacterota bacterium]